MFWLKKIIGMRQCKVVRLSVRFKNVKENTHQNKTNRNKHKCDTCLCKRAVFDIIKDRTDISYLNLIHKIIPKNDVNRSLRHEYWSNSRKTFFFNISNLIELEVLFLLFWKKKDSELKVCLSHLIQINLNYINYVWHYLNIKHQ